VDSLFTQALKSLLSFIPLTDCNAVTSFDFRV